MNGTEISAVGAEGAVDSSDSEQAYAFLPATWSHSVRALLALLLLVAAGLKSYQLIDKPVPAVFVLGSRWLSIVAIEWELFLGLWLLSGVRVFHAWWGAFLTLSLFSVISLVKAVAGDSSCGCFGYVEVSPWVTLVIDLCAVGALLRARSRWAGNGWAAGDGRPDDEPKCQHRPKRPGRSERPGRWNFSWAASFVVVGGPLAVWIGLAEPSRLDSTAGILGTGDLVILEPEEWVGERFALLEHLVLDADVSTGSWNVVLYHETCPKCQEALPKYMRLASVMQHDASFPQLALIEVVEEGHSPARGGPWKTGTLSDDHEWFVTAPVQITVQDGTVTHVLDEKAIFRWLDQQLDTTR